jgi:hypothetical protein
MTLTPYVLAFQFAAGIIGCCVVIPQQVIPPSSENIDHPSRPWRIFYRLMTLCMCNLFSWLVTMILLVSLLEDVDSSGLSDVKHALLMAVMPVPLLIVFYWLVAKVARKGTRDLDRFRRPSTTVALKDPAPGAEPAGVKRKSAKKKKRQWR